MAKDVIITPANGTVDFLDATGNTDGIIQLDDSGNLKITNPGGDLTIGDVTSDLYIGDGINSVDIIFEQNGAIRGLTGKTLTLGQSDSSVNVAANITGGLRVSAGNVGIGTSTPLSLLDVRGNVYLGGTDTGPTVIAFRGTTGDQPGNYNHTYIGERIWQTTERSELFIFKGNDVAGASGPDRVRIGAGEFRVDTFGTALSGDFDTVANSASLTTKFIVETSGNVGIGTTSPTSNLHVVGNANITTSINTATINATTVNAATLLTSSGINVVSVALNAYGQANAARDQANTATLNYSYNTSSTSAETVDSWSVTTYRSGLYQMQVTSSFGYLACQIAIVHDGSSCNLIQYGNSSFGSSLGAFTSDISAGLVRLRFAAADATTRLRYYRSLLLLDPTADPETLPTDLETGSDTYDLMNDLYIAPLDLNA